MVVYYSTISTTHGSKRSRNQQELQIVTGYGVWLSCLQEQVKRNMRWQRLLHVGMCHHRVLGVRDRTRRDAAFVRQSSFCKKEGFGAHGTRDQRSLICHIARTWLCPLGLQYDALPHPAGLITLIGKKRKEGWGTSKRKEKGGGVLGWRSRLAIVPLAEQVVLIIRVSLLALLPVILEAEIRDQLPRLCQGFRGEIGRVRHQPVQHLPADVVCRRWFARSTCQ